MNKVIAVIVALFVLVLVGSKLFGSFLSSGEKSVSEGASVNQSIESTAKRMVR